jgi:O-antigen/teichoic acid export membrane protein
MLGGNVVGQAVAFLVYPILTRLYTGIEFGIFATYTSLCSLLVILGTARYEESLVIAENSRETVNLFGFTLKWLTIFCMLILTALMLFGKPLLNAFKMQELMQIRYYIPLSVFLMGLLTLFNNIAVREKKFKTFASANIVRNSANAAGKLSFGWTSMTNCGLVWANVLALLASVSVYFPMRKHFFKTFGNKWKEEKQTAIKYRDFPTFNLARSLLNAFSTNLPLYMIGIFGAKETGLFSLSLVVLSTPITLICNSLYSTFFEQITSRKNNRMPILPMMKSYWKNLFLFLLPCFIVLICVAKPLFCFIFGEQWTDSGIYFQYMALWWFMVMTTSPLFSVFMVFRKQHKTLFAEIIYLFVRMIALYIGVYYMDLKLGIMAFSVAGIVFAVSYIIWIYRIIGEYEKKEMIII